MLLSHVIIVVLTAWVMGIIGGINVGYQLCRKDFSGKPAKKEDAP
jgi:hypothetical protein